MSYPRMTWRVVHTASSSSIFPDEGRLLEREDRSLDEDNKCSSYS
jgi:hypothetical protein